MNLVLAISIFMFLGSLVFVLVRRPVSRSSGAAALGSISLSAALAVGQLIPAGMVRMLTVLFLCLATGWFLILEIRAWRSDQKNLGTKRRA